MPRFLCLLTFPKSFFQSEFPIFSPATPRRFSNSVVLQKLTRFPQAHSTDVVLSSLCPPRRWSDAGVGIKMLSGIPLLSANYYNFRLINGLIGPFLAFYSALGVWLMAQGSWLMTHGLWLMAHGLGVMANKKNAARAWGLGDPAANFYWP